MIILYGRDSFPSIVTLYEKGCEMRCRFFGNMKYDGTVKEMNVLKKMALFNSVVFVEKLEEAKKIS